MVFAAARRPSSRSVRASSAGRSTSGSASRVTGSDVFSAQARTRAVASAAAAARAGLKAYPYNAARSAAAGGRPGAGPVSAGVTVASASARLARE
jgi:hypothetical protein